ncbi:MAG: fumarylacetoacetate hydrolase family protein [Paracoccus sp. (in: a-proteobacteria)]|nr:fumarylacetoacetate hydrolase family protein [Paracoccus sp. (in: a-proteobacteria)]
MKLVCFRVRGEVRHGVLRDGVIHEIATDPEDRQAVSRILAAPNTAQETDRAFDPAEVTFLPPIPAPGKIFCVATNFREPANAGKPLPEHPLLFTRFADSLVGHDQPLRKPDESQCYDFEGELAAVIGRPGFCIPRDRAQDHIAGYACFNDGSVRDWQKHSTQFTPGKNFLASGSFGPALVTPDEFGDFGTLRLETRVNGEVMQSISMAAMIFDVAWLVAYISTFAPLAPGDVIITGTPSGFGSSRKPQCFLAPGDVVEVEISGLGLLRNRVEAAKNFVTENNFENSCHRQIIAV